MFDIKNSAHVSKYIDTLVRASNLLFKLHDDLVELDDISDVNDINTILDAVDAEFPAGTSVTPVSVNDARRALAAIKTDIVATLQAGRVRNINKVRNSVGILAGTG